MKSHAAVTLVAGAAAALALAACKEPSEGMESPGVGFDGVRMSGEGCEGHAVSTPDRGTQEKVLIYTRNAANKVAVALQKAPWAGNRVTRGIFSKWTGNVAYTDDDLPGYVHYAKGSQAEGCLFVNADGFREAESEYRAIRAQVLRELARAAARSGMGFQTAHEWLLTVNKTAIGLDI